MRFLAAISCALAEFFLREFKPGAQQGLRVFNISKGGNYDNAG